MLKLADCALSWKDVEIWRRLAESSTDWTIDVLGRARLLRAWKTFGFANVMNRLVFLLLFEFHHLAFTVSKKYWGGLPIRRIFPKNSTFCIFSFKTLPPEKWMRFADGVAQ